jgi:putative membrane protein
MSKRIALWLSVVCLAIFAYPVARVTLTPLIALPALPNATPIVTVSLLLFSLLHGYITLGAPNTLIFFAISAIVSWTLEEVGVRTGLVYGPYHYSDMLGAKLGEVPLLIPLAWFMMIYPSFVLANLIVDRRPTSRRGSPRHVLALSLVSAIVMTAWDLPMDPQMSGAGNWIWERGGAYFGVPLHNFAGWLLTTFIVYLLFRLFEQWRTAHGHAQSEPSRIISSLPVLAYGLVATPYAFVSDPPALRLIACFAMGFPLLLAAINLIHLERIHENDK